MGASKDRDSIVHLAKVLDLAAAAALKSDLAAVRGTSTVVDGSDVQRVGTQCAQVLLGACRTWQAENQTFEIVNASEALREGLNRLGVTEMLNVVEIVA